MGKASVWKVFEDAPDLLNTLEKKAKSVLTFLPKLKPLYANSTIREHKRWKSTKKEQQRFANPRKEIGPSDGGVGAPKKPSAFQKFFMAEKLSNYIRKRRNRSSTSSGGETSPFQEAKKPRDLTETEDESTGSDHETNDEVMAALYKIEHIREQLNSIIDRLSKLSPWADV